MEESESDCVHKSVNKEKDSNSEADHNEPTVTDYPVVKEPRNFNIFECGKNILNKLGWQPQEINTLRNFQDHNRLKW